jgi:hypothetical protein
VSTTKPGWVYFLESVGISPPRLKIGYTARKPTKRRLEVEYSAGVEMRLLGYIWGSAATGDSEWDLHKRFARWRITRSSSTGPSGDYLGEFFKIEIKDSVVKLIREGRKTKSLRKAKS